MVEPLPKLPLVVGRFQPLQLLHKLSGSELQLHSESSSKRSESSKLNRSHSSFHSGATTSCGCGCGGCCGCTGGPPPTASPTIASSSTYPCSERHKCSARNEKEIDVRALNYMCILFYLLFLFEFSFFCHNESPTAILQTLNEWYTDATDRQDRNTANTLPFQHNNTLWKMK